MEQLLSNEWLLNAVTRVCGGAIWLQGFRGCSRLTRRLVRPETRKFPDEECMLVEGARSGDLGLCSYAMSIGACRFYKMARKAASHGNYAVFRLAAATPDISFCLKLENTSTRKANLMLAAIKGGNRDIFAFMRGLYSNLDNVRYNNALRIEDVLAVGWRSLHFDYALEMLQHVFTYTEPERYDDDSPLYLYMMYGYSGDEKYRAFAESISHDYGHDGVYASTGYVHIIEGAVRSGNDERIAFGVKLLEDLPEVPVENYFVNWAVIGYLQDLIRMAKLVPAVKYGVTKYLELPEREEQYYHLFKQASLAKQREVCSWLISKGASDANTMLDNFARFSSEAGIMGCEKAIQLGASNFDTALLTAAQYENYPMCLRAMNLGARNLAIALWWGLDVRSLSICRAVVAEGRRRFESSVRSNKVRRFMASLFGYKSPKELRKVLISGDLGTLTSVPFLCVVLCANRRWLRKLYGRNAARDVPCYISPLEDDENSVYRDKTAAALESWMRDCRIVRGTDGEVHIV